MTSSEQVAKSAAKAKKGEQKEEGLKEIVLTVFWAVVIAMGFRTVAYEPFNIPSESMLPTLMIGDYLTVSKWSYGYSKHSMPMSLPLFEGRILESDVERGDVVVFKLPRDGKSDFIKRLIGLPGDKIQMRGGVLYINGEAVKRERVPDFAFKETPYNSCKRFPQYRFMGSDGVADCRYPQFKETLPSGKSYMTLDLMPNGMGDNTRVYTVPQGHYFGMGDNRDNSMDSRRPSYEGVGFIPAENLIGRAESIMLSVNGKARQWELWNWWDGIRGSRTFTSLRPEGNN